MKKYYGMTAKEVLAMVEGSWMDEEGDVIVPTTSGCGCALYVDEETGKIVGHCFCDWAC